MREARDLHPAPEPFDSARAFARWSAFLKTGTSRGFTSPPFEHLLFGPVVHLDLLAHDPPDELRDKTLTADRRLREPLH